MCKVHLFAVLKLFIPWKCNGKASGLGSIFQFPIASNFWHIQ